MCSRGSVRKPGNRVRVTGQLINATAGAHLWADRFDSSLDDIFDLHNELATSVVGAIAAQLERAEIPRAKHRPTEKLDAYDYYLRGMASFHQGNQEGRTEALPLFDQAIERDPGFASAYAMAAACLFWSKFNGWVTDRSQVTSEGARLAYRAIELHRGLHNCGKSCVRRPNGRRATSDSKSPATGSRSSAFQPEGLASLPSTGISHHLPTACGEPDCRSSAA